jgi:hypothetical protein
MLTPRFLDVVVRSLEKLAKKLVKKTDRVCARTHEVFVSYMLTTLKDENVKDKTLVAIIKKLTFSAGGELMFDRITGKLYSYSQTVSLASFAMCLTEYFLLTGVL